MMSQDVPRSIDGRTLLVLMRWAQVLLDDSDGLMLVVGNDATELRAAVANVKYAMEHVKFPVVE